MKSNLVIGLVVTFLLVDCASGPPSKINFSPADYSQGDLGAYSLAECADQLTQKVFQTMRSQGKHRIAVVGFLSDDGQQNELGRYLADKLTNNLFMQRSDFDVVDRMHLEEAWDEIKLSLSGKIEPDTVQELGKILGADAIMVGTLKDLGSRVEIISRIIDTEGANILAVAQVYLRKDEEVNFLFLHDEFQMYIGRARNAVAEAMSNVSAPFWDYDDAIKEADIAVNAALSISPRNQEALALKRLINSLR